MSQFYIVDVWEDHVGCSNAYAVSTEDLAMKKAAQLRDENRWDTIEVRGPFTIDDGNDLIGDHSHTVYNDDAPKLQARELRAGEGSLLQFILQPDAHCHNQSFHTVPFIRLEVY